MRRLIFFTLILSGIALFVIACAERDNVPTIETEIYFVDAEMTRLLPYKTEIIDADAAHQAEAVVDKLIEGRDDNDKIRRLIPQEKDWITVTVDTGVAYVDMKSDIADCVPDSRDIERLIVYQIVDSLTSIKGIRFVKFYIDGEIHKNFMGYFDMRETYKYQYPE